MLKIPFSIIFFLASSMMSSIRSTRNIKSIQFNWLSNLGRKNTKIISFAQYILNTDTCSWNNSQIFISAYFQWNVKMWMWHFYDSSNCWDLKLSKMQLLPFSKSKHKLNASQTMYYIAISMISSIFRFSE